MDSLLADLRYALRLLSRSPGFTLVVIGVLALGIGSNSAIFTALDKTVIRPLPYRDPNRLAMLWEDFSAYGASKSRVSPATFLDWKRKNQSFEEIAAYRNGEMDFSGGGSPEQVFGVAVTSNLIPTLGVPPALGRTFTHQEEPPGNRLVVLSHRIWQRRFAGDPHMVGASILMSGEKYSVIGVMPQGFHFPDRETDFWIPLGLEPSLLARRNSHFMKVVGRLKRNRDWSQAQSDMSAVARQLESEFPASNARIGVKVVPLKDDVLGDSRTAFIILLSAAGCVLLIACANVGNLLLVRASARQREIAVRIALGAAPSRILRQVLTENLLLSGTGGAIGLVFAQASLAVLQKMVPVGLAGSVNLRLDFRVLGFTAAVSIFTALLFGLAPALQLSRMNLSSRGTVTPARGKLRDFLVVAEVAIALVLVVGASLLIETLVHLRSVDPGFRSTGILTANISVPFPKYSDTGKRQRFFNEVLSRVRSLPGVQSAGSTSDLPYTSRGNTQSLIIEGKPAARDMDQDALFRLVSSDYLQTIGARLKEGRFLSDVDRLESAPVVVINETLARQFWPNESPLGHRIDTGTGIAGPRFMTIVGVVADIRERGLDLAVKPAVYVPFTQTEITYYQPSEIAVRTSRDPLSLSKELQQTVWSIDPEQPVSNIRTMHAIVDGELSNRTQILEFLGAFAALALLLAALGIYGVLSYVVSQRTREIGLRMAIGASQWDIVRTILGYSAGLIAVGLAAGIAAALGATRLLSSLLFGVSPLDPATFAVVSALLATVAFLASYLPTRRAAAVDPMIALRDE
ncbi:MAG TPA: ABC transporter permease [Bryobacteraceae bacterium]|nr:ABC transporter permease [Bryobacteraceae bacterium]